MREQKEQPICAFFSFVSARDRIFFLCRRVRQGDRSRQGLGKLKISCTSRSPCKHAATIVCGNDMFPPTPQQQPFLQSFSSAGCSWSLALSDCLASTLCFPSLAAPLRCYAWKWVTLLESRFRGRSPWAFRAVLAKTFLLPQLKLPQSSDLERFCRTISQRQLSTADLPRLQKH